MSGSPSSVLTLGYAIGSQIGSAGLILSLGFGIGVPAPPPPPAPVPVPVVQVVPVPVPRLPPPPLPAVPVGAATGGGGGGLPQDLVRLLAEPSEEEEVRPAPVQEPPRPPPKAKRRKPLAPLVLPGVPLAPTVAPPPPLVVPPMRMRGRRILVPPAPARPHPLERRGVILVTEEWGGLGLALLMQRQGSDVVCAYDYGKVKPDDLPATERCGDGLVEKLPLEQALRRCTGRGKLWVFDANDFPTVADDLRRQGELVIGTSLLGQKLEDDRDFAMQIAQAAGFAVPMSEEFHNYRRAVRWLQAHADQAFVYKPDKQDPTATYVPQEKTDVAKANTELQQYLQHLPGNAAPSFVLQEVIHGTEAAFDLWLRDGQPVAAFCDLESKRKLVGDLGSNIGCAGDYVFSVPLDSLGVERTVGRYLRDLRFAHYTGSIDANVIIRDGVPFFLENCARFGYNAYPVMFQALATAPMEEILRAWVAGEGSMTGAFQPAIGGSLTIVVDYPTAGTPLLVPRETADAVYLYRSYQEGDGLAVVEGWSEVACVVSAASSIPEAGRRCLAMAEQVGIPGKGYRVDLADATLPTLPLARYQALQWSGWIPDPGDEQAILEVLAVLEAVDA